MQNTCICIFKMRPCCIMGTKTRGHLQERLCCTAKLPAHSSSADLNARGGFLTLQLLSQQSVNDFPASVLCDAVYVVCHFLSECFHVAEIPLTADWGISSRLTCCIYHSIRLTSTELCRINNSFTNLCKGRLFGYLLVSIARGNETENTQI